MKYISIKYLATTLIALGMLVACDPIKDGFDADNTALSAEELQITAIPVVVDGVNSNEIIVENHSPIPSEWTIEQLGTLPKTSTKSCDKLYATHTGTNEIKFRGFNALAGTYAERTLTVQVDAITTIPPYIAERLCIGKEGAPTGFASNLDIDKIQIIVEKDANGLNGNKVTLINPNPVLTDWDFGGEISDKNIAELYVLTLGEIPLKASFTLADGSKVEHEFPAIEVETFTYKPEFLENLTGGDKGEQAWTWAAAPKPIYGLGGYGSTTGPDWAPFGFDLIGGLASAVGKNGEGSEGATMTFKLTGELFTSSGRQGTWSFDLEKGIPGWSIGKLYTHGVSVLYGHSFDTTTYIGPEIYEYDIVLSTSGELTLCAPFPAGMGTFWCFRVSE